ncbi:hypothetical protein GGR53DRAFT_529304 [Hypoxylon sp. FL1150]|nr:hypothetical protein GGR53DRAFT_529304 [Hypoxylon sp. FL1150]
MGSKRASGNNGGGAVKKRRQSYRDNVQNATSMTYGQRSAFGDDELITTVPKRDEDLDCEDDLEALNYLRSVRAQASLIPHVLVADKAGPALPPQTLQQPAYNLDLDIDLDDEPNPEDPIDRSIYLDGTGDFRGYYQDGAYVAYPPGYFDEEEEEEEDEYEDEDDYEEDYDYEGEYQDYDEKEEIAEEEDVNINHDEFEDYDENDIDSSEGGPRNSNVDEIREAYFASLTNQFLGLRALLQTDPPPHLLARLPRSNPTEVGGFGPGTDTFSRWAGRLRGTDPLPAQVAGMRGDGVVRLLRVVLGGKFLRKKQELRERTSRWLWALLARLPDRGQLDYQAVGWVRELGKRAVLLMVSLAEMEVLREHYDVGNGGSADGAEVEVDEGIDEELGPEECNDYDDVALDTTWPPEPATHGDHKKADTRLDAAEEPTNDTKIKAEESDVEMQIDSDEEQEDGEVSAAPQQPQEPTADIETAKARLLSQLDGAATNTTETAASSDVNTDAHPVGTTAEEARIAALMSEGLSTDLEKEAIAALAADEAAQKKAQLRRARANERATLNMILTVAGEFYGQRDLLEFRDPFGGMQAE